MIASIILAAGESRRMGSPKLSLNYEGKTLLEYAIDKAALVTDEVFVVVGAYKDLYTSIAKETNAKVSFNPAWEEGLGSSLSNGVAALEDTTALALILLADQPFVPLEHLTKLIETQQETGADLVFSSYEATQGPPMVMARSMFKAARDLTGTCGAKALISKDTKLASIKLEQFDDIDTPEDAKRLLKKHV